LPEELNWPPNRDDLQRLYLEERLSAMKIANRYGLRYASPKTAESTVLYQLKKFGIKRRDPAEHIRKVTESMVDEWVERYQRGESLKQIAGAHVDPVTVWNHLKRRNVALREKVEAQIQAVTKYERRPFDGDSIQKAYLLGLRYGDLNVVRHGRAIRVRVSTTHPAMADLFESLFSPYGHVQRYPRRAILTRCEWSLECDLDASFEFLLGKRMDVQLDSSTRNERLAFLAGLFDSEGTVYYHRKREFGSFELFFTNKSEELLRWIGDVLSELNVKWKLERRIQDSRRLNGGKNDQISRIVIWRTLDVEKLLQLLVPRHEERIKKKAIALEFIGSFPKEKGIVTKWRELNASLKLERDRFVDSARVALLEPVEK
jgi:hypothetical protein